jgi:hypothetical protein
VIVPRIKRRHIGAFGNSVRGYNGAELQHGNHAARRPSQALSRGLNQLVGSSR